MNRNARLAALEARLGPSRQTSPSVELFLSALSVDELRRCELLVQGWPGQVVPLELARRVIADTPPELTAEEFETSRKGMPS